VSPSTAKRRLGFATILARRRERSSSGFADRAAGRAILIANDPARAKGGSERTKLEFGSSREGKEEIVGSIERIKEKHIRK